MPAEPERDIEKTLKAYAERRRQQAGAPLELHLATRRMLQAEAARLRTGKAKHSGFWSEMAALIRRRLVIASALVAMVVAITLVFVPALNRAKRDQMASTRSLDGATRREPSAGELAKARTFDDSLADKKKLSNAVETSTLSAERAVALDQSAAASANEKQKDAANAPLNRPVTSPEPLLADRLDTAKVAAIGQNAGPAPSSLPEGGVGGHSFAANSLTSAAPPPPGVLGVARQRAGEILPTFQATNALAFRSEAAQVQNQTDNLTLSTAAASAPPVNFAAQAPPISAPPSGALAAPALAMSDSDSAAVTQRFYRLYGSARKTTTTKAPRNRGVLDSFRVEQSGAMIRVIDGDGSVYSGFVQASDQPSQQFYNSGARSAREAESAQPATKAAPDQPADARSAGLPAASGYYFRVTGTNQTSRQPVVFSGTFMPVSPQISGVITGSQGRAVSGLVQPATATPGALPLSRLQLRGRALIGATNAIDVNASSTPQ
jgi:hypothetical protein